MLVGLVGGPFDGDLHFCIEVDFSPFWVFVGMKINMVPCVSGVGEG